MKKFFLLFLMCVSTSYLACADADTGTQNRWWQRTKKKKQQPGSEKLSCRPARGSQHKRTPRAAREDTAVVSAQMEQLKAPIVAATGEQEPYPIFATDNSKGTFTFREQEFKVTDFYFSQPSRETLRQNNTDIILFVIDRGGIIIHTPKNSPDLSTNIKGAKSFATTTIALVYKGKCVIFNNENFSLLTPELVEDYAQN